jgi:hypothetical protein
MTTSAALILAISFLSLSTSPDLPVRMIATGLSFGILLDAFVIRTLLVPALSRSWAAGTGGCPQASPGCCASRTRVCPTPRRDRVRAMRPRSQDAAIAIVAAAALIADGTLRRDGALPVGGYALALVACAPLAWRRVAPLAVLLAELLAVLACLPVFEALRDRGVRRDDPALHRGRVGRAAAVARGRRRHRGRAGGGDRARRGRRGRRRPGGAAARPRAQRVGGRGGGAHDTIAHSLAAINVRSGVAARLGCAQDGSAALHDIKTISAEALRDLRATLSLLREHGDAAPVGPSLDLGEVPRLVSRARAAGIGHRRGVELGGATIPTPVGQAGYRVVREALTTVLRHAGASSARVDVRLAGDGLDIEVVDDGQGGAATGDGLGLRGMSERAAALGGEVLAGPQQRGGWRVWAHLPLTEAGGR